MNVKNDNPANIVESSATWPNAFENMKTKLFIIGIATLALTVCAEEFGSIGLVIVDRSKADEPFRTGVVYSGSPAERAGIKSDGFLISVNGTNVAGMSLTQTRSIMRGPIGADMTLEIADSTMSHTNTFTVTRKRAAFSGHGADMRVEFFDR